MKDRKVVIDTETTGIQPKNGDRVIRIAIAEAINGKLTRNNLISYVNPDEIIDPKILKFVNISQETLNNAPKFEEISEEIIKFISDSDIIIHKADFDLSFLRAEFKRIGKTKVFKDNKIIDTLTKHRKEFPGQSASIDHLCEKYGIISKDDSYEDELRVIFEIYKNLFEV